jgi:uncharacterized membrane-anchored protein
MIFILILTIVALVLFISGLLIKKKKDFKKSQNEYNIALEKAQKIISSYDKEQFNFDKPQLIKIDENTYFLNNPKGEKLTDCNYITRQDGTKIYLGGTKL